MVSLSESQVWEAGTDGQTHIVAEMACSHEGDPALAREIIDGAGRAEADAIQFQIWKLQEMMVPDHRDLGKVSKIELAQEQWGSLYRSDSRKTLSIASA